MATLYIVLELCVCSFAYLFSCLFTCLFIDARESAVTILRPVASTAQSFVPTVQCLRVLGVKHVNETENCVLSVKLCPDFFIFRTNID